MSVSLYSSPCMVPRTCLILILTYEMASISSSVSSIQPEGRRRFAHLTWVTCVLVSPAVIQIGQLLFFVTWTLYFAGPAVYSEQPVRWLIAGFLPLIKIEGRFPQITTDRRFSTFPPLGMSPRWLKALNKPDKRTSKQTRETEITN